MSGLAGRLLGVLVLAGAIGIAAAKTGFAQAAPQDWQSYGLGDARFAAPPGWTSENFEQDETVMLVSSHGKSRLWVSWWQPDEPLLGYEDIVSHDIITVGGFPALRIHSRFPTYEAISITLEAARADGKRLQFLFEHAGDLHQDPPLLEKLLRSVTIEQGAVSEDPLDHVVSGDKERSSEQGWKRYVNARFGTSLEYPAALLRMLPPPDNDDGRGFEGIRHDLTVLVYASHNVFDADVRTRLAELAAPGEFETIERIEAGETRLFLEGRRDGRIIRLTEIHEQGDVIHTLRISHAPAIGRVLAEQVEQLERSFSVERPAPVRSRNDAGQAELIFWQSIATSTDPDDFDAYLAQWPEGIFAQLARNRLSQLAAPDAPLVPHKITPSREPAAYHEPARGSAERAAIMDAARLPVAEALGQRVIFVIERLRSDGQVAYLQAVPHQPDGTPLDWTSTPFAREWQAGFMSDIVMVLLKQSNDTWQVLDYVIGPTDVHWVSWKRDYALPSVLFHD